MTELEVLYDSWKKGLIPLDTILENQKTKIETIAKKYAMVSKYRKRTNYDIDDWVSHGLKACYLSCLKFDPKNSGECSLDSYITGGIILEFNNVLDRRKRKKYENDDIEYVGFDDYTSDLENHTYHDVVEDTLLPSTEEVVELKDLCKYYSNGDPLIEETYFMLSQGYKQSDVARKHNIRVGTLNNRMKRHQQKILGV